MRYTHITIVPVLLGKRIWTILSFKKINNHIGKLMRYTHITIVPALLGNRMWTILSFHSLSVITQTSKLQQFWGRERRETREKREKETKRTRERKREKKRERKRKRERERKRQKKLLASLELCIPSSVSGKYTHFIIIIKWPRV